MAEAPHWSRAGLINLMMAAIMAGPCRRYEQPERGGTSITRRLLPKELFVRRVKVGICFLLKERWGSSTDILKIFSTCNDFHFLESNVNRSSPNRMSMPEEGRVSHEVLFTQHKADGELNQQPPHFFPLMTFWTDSQFQINKNTSIDRIHKSLLRSVFTLYISAHEKIDFLFLK